MQFDPVGVVAIFIGDDRAVRGHELVDEDDGAVGGEDEGGGGRSPSCAFAVGGATAEIMDGFRCQPGDKAGERTPHDTKIEGKLPGGGVGAPVGGSVKQGDLRVLVSGVGDFTAQRGGGSGIGDGGTVFDDGGADHRVGCEGAVGLVESPMPVARGTVPDTGTGGCFGEPEHLEGTGGVARRR